MRNSKKTTYVLETFIEYLHECNRRITPERISILEVISKQSKVFSIEDLHDKMSKEAFPVAVATIYNTVELLMDAGLVKSIKLPESSATLYTISAGEMSHIFLICEQCGAVTENKAKELSSFVNKYDFPKFSSKSFTLNVYGICQKCRKLNENNKSSKQIKNT